MEPSQSNKSRPGLKQLRRAANLTQAQAANRLGVTEKAFRSYENDGAIPSFDKAVALAKMFKVPLKRIAEEFGLDIEGIPDDGSCFTEDQLN